LASKRGLDKEAVDFGQRALALAREFGDTAIESHALNSIGAALLIAGDLSGYEPLERSLAMALEKKLEESAARAYSNLVFCATLGHDFVCAEKFFREGVAYCEERGLFSSVAYVRAYGSRLALDRGDWAEAARRVFELSQTTELVPVQRVPTRVTLALVRIRRGPRENTRANPAGLSATEFEVLVLLTEGCSNAQIAGRLCRSTRTIDHHVSAVLGKLGVHSRAEAIAATSALGIVNMLSDASARRRT
jgi:DNA-binding CsgD family transcriptional regulator